MVEQDHRNWNQHMQDLNNLKKFYSSRTYLWLIFNHPYRTYPSIFHLYLYRFYILKWPKPCLIRYSSLSHSYYPHCSQFTCLSFNYAPPPPSSTNSLQNSGPPLKNNWTLLKYQMWHLMTSSKGFMCNLTSPISPKSSDLIGMPMLLTCRMNILLFSCQRTSTLLSTAISNSKWVSPSNKKVS